MATAGQQRRAPRPTESAAELPLRGPPVASNPPHSRGGAAPEHCVVLLPPPEAEGEGEYPPAEAMGGWGRDGAAACGPSPSQGAAQTPTESPATDIREHPSAATGRAPADSGGGAGPCADASGGGAAGALVVARTPGLEHPPQLPQPVPEEDERLEPWLEQVSILAHLAVFSMVGVLLRYALEILFGPLGAHVTDDSQSLFLDVPANMAGSFLMGMVGLLFKKDIAAFSQPLAIGLSTGFCGSLTTYASWNQRMMSILAPGLVLRALFGYVLGTAVAMHSFEAGVDAGRLLQEWVCRRMDKAAKACKPVWEVQPENFQRRWGSLVGFVGLSILLWAVAGVMFAFNTSYPKVRKASLGCMVGPFGTWLRWYLSGLNGRGLGKQRHWEWVPLGTLAANLLAVLLEAVSSAVDATHNTELGSIMEGGLQLGFMGSLSTVSTLMLEVYLLNRAEAKRWRGYVYLYFLTFAPSILIGIVAYCVPVWVFSVAANGYNKAYRWNVSPLTLTMPTDVLAP